MFAAKLKKQLIQEAGNYFTDNHDHLRPQNKRFKKKIINYGKYFLYRKPLFKVLFSNDFIFKKIFLGKLFSMESYLKPLNFFYTALEDEESKNLLLKLMAFRTLGNSKVKLPLSNPQYWAGLKKVEALKIENDSINLNHYPWKIYLHELDKLGIPIKLYLDSKTIYTTFCIEQYYRKINNAAVGVKKGDVVLDLGGCYGDTALYFAEKAGEKGKVFTFEFIPNSIDIIKKNLEINPNIKERIEIINRPLWATSAKEVYFKDQGASSQVSFEKFPGYTGTTSTLCLDDFMQESGIERIDFIKTDVEGAEPYVIKGAEQLLRKFKPSLAISIYHNMSDFTGIIRQIADFGIGYKFYLGHATIFSSETVLFCINENRINN